MNKISTKCTVKEEKNNSFMKFNLVPQFIRIRYRKLVITTQLQVFLTFPIFLVQPFLHPQISMTQFALRDPLGTCNLYELTRPAAACQYDTNPPTVPYYSYHNHYCHYIKLIICSKHYFSILYNRRKEYRLINSFVSLIIHRLKDNKSL